jgi:autotransporter-associated beta strand protein
MFLNGAEKTTFEVTSGTEIIAGTDAIAGEGGFIKRGTGTLLLRSTNSYAGGTILKGGTLEIAAPRAAGTGAITFAGAAELKIEQRALTHHVLHNPIRHFAHDDVLDFSGLTFQPGAAATFHPGSHALTVHSGLVTDTVRLISPGGTQFTVTDDGHGGSEVMLAPVHATMASLSLHHAEGRHLGADVLGGAHHGWDPLFVA